MPLLINAVGDLGQTHGQLQQWTSEPRSLGSCMRARIHGSIQSCILRSYPSLADRVLRVMRTMWAAKPLNLEASKLAHSWQMSGHVLEQSDTYTAKLRPRILHQPNTSSLAIHIFAKDVASNTHQPKCDMGTLGTISQHLQLFMQVKFTMHANRVAR